MRIRILRAITLAALALAITSRPAQADRLNPILLFPDITSSFMTIDYNATTDVFTATSTSLVVSFNGGPPQSITLDQYTLTANIDQGQSLLGGTLTVAGNVAGNPSPLLTGALTAFGFGVSSPGTPPTFGFDFLFDVTGGSLASLFGSTGGIILTASEVGVDTLDFSSGFNFNGLENGTSAIGDTASVVPEPASIVSTATAACGLVGLLIGLRRAEAAESTASGLESPP